MTKQSFKPSIAEDLNRPYDVTLTEGQISTILYIMEWYLSNTDDSSDTAFTRDCDRIFAELESVTDNFYASLESVTQ